MKVLKPQGKQELQAIFMIAGSLDILLIISEVYGGDMIKIMKLIQLYRIRPAYGAKL